MLYHIKDSNYPHIIIKEIKREEYEVVEEFSKFFRLYEGVTFAYANYWNSLNHYNEFMEYLKTSKNSLSLNKVQNQAIYPITSVIIFLNTFIDNTKNFNSTIKSTKIKSKIQELNKLESIKILRAVRNYAIHASIPVKGALRQINLMTDEEKYEFFIEKITLIDNKPNRNDLKNLKNLATNKIVLNHMIDEVTDNLESLSLKTLEEFLNFIPSDVKSIFYKYVRFYKTSDGSEYFANSFVKSEEDGKTNRGTSYITKETIYFDPGILELVVSQIHSNMD